jgi:nitrous oxidase accessory protein
MPLDEDSSARRHWKSASGSSLLLGALALLFATRSREEIQDAPPPPTPSYEVGPAPRELPASAAVVHDEQELKQLLARADGPRELQLQGGIYRGDLVIRRPVALYGDGRVVLEGSGHDTVVSIESDDVILENLSVRHSGRRQTTEDAAIRARGTNVRINHVAVTDSLFGITLGPCPRCVVENCRVRGLTGAPEQRGDGIKLWESNDAVVRHNVVDEVRDVVVWYSRRVVLDGNRVSHSRYGTHFMYAHDSVVRNSLVEHNTVGVFVMYSSRLQVEHNVLAGARGAAGMGIGFKESDGVLLSGNWLVANTTGLYLDRTPLSATKPVVFSDNVIALNDVAMGFLGAEAGLSFERNDFRANINLVNFDAEGQALQARFANNRWSDYAGYDLNRDGVGDVPFQVKQLSRELVDSTPALGLFQGTAAFELIDAVAHVVPVLSSRVLLSDATPMLSNPIAQRRN